MILTYPPPMDAPLITFWRDQPGLEISRVQASTHVFPRHYHDDLYAIGIIHQGASFCVGPRHAESMVTQGQACLINPGQIHSGVPVSGASLDYVMIYVHMDLLRQVAEDLRQKPSACPEFRTMICARPDLILSLHRLVRTLTTTCAQLERQSALVRALGDLVQAHDGATGASPRHDAASLLRAKELLGTDLDQKITVRDAASAAGLSQYQFLRQFKSLTGITPHAFRTQQRIARAQSLIRRGMPFSEVALTTGFADQPHFTNTFKLYTGAKPSQYAARRGVPVHSQPQEKTCLQRL